MIDSRIGAVVNFVKKNSRVADIGTDHGYLAVELVKLGRAKFVIAGDKNPAPLAAAQKNITAAGLEKIIDVRLGDGLKILQAGEVDTICIAGMGGALIAEILAASPEILARAENLILQPMNALDKVYAWLGDNGWLVANVALAEVGTIIYEIICATKNPAEIHRPTFKEISPLLSKSTAQRLQKLQRVAEEMSKSAAALQSEKFAQIQAEINSLKQK